MTCRAVGCARALLQAASTPLCHAGSAEEAPESLSCGNVWVKC